MSNKRWCILHQNYEFEQCSGNKYMSQDEELEKRVSPTIQELERVSENNSPDTIEMLYIESSNIGLVEFRKRIQALYRTREVTLIREAELRVYENIVDIAKRNEDATGWADAYSSICDISSFRITELTNQQKGEQ